MSFSFLYNQTPATFTKGMYDWMLFMVGDPSWTCVKSGDGLTNYSSTQSVFSTDSSGAGGMGNNRAWFVLKHPGSTRELCFQRSSIETYWRVKYSVNGFGAGSPSSTQTPSASDEKILLGSGTDASPVMDSLFNHLTANSFVLTAGADNADGYAFYMFTYNKGDLRNPNSIKTFFMFDSLSSGPYALPVAPSTSNTQLDTDPFAIAIGNSPGYHNTIWLGRAADVDPSATKFAGYIAKGVSSREAFVNLSIAGWGDSSGSNAWCPSTNQELNPHNSYEDLCPILYFYKNANSPNSLDPSQGYKGVSNNFFMGSLQRNNGDLYNYDDPADPDPNTQGRKIYIGGFALPWNNQNPTP
jgi:hypothetical protein